MSDSESGGIDPPESVAEKLASCPQAMKELAGALLPTLVDSLEQLAERRMATRTGGSDHVHEQGSYGRGNEYFHQGNEARWSTGNEAMRATGNEATEPTGNGTRQPTGKEARMDPGIEARRATGRGATLHAGIEARQSTSMEASHFTGNEANPAWGTERGHEGPYPNAVGGTQPFMANPWPGAPYQGAAQNMFLPWNFYTPPGFAWGGPQVTGALPIQGRKRPRPAEAPSTSSSRSQGELTDDEVDPFLSDTERNELLSGSEDSDEEEEKEPPSKKKFTPSEDTKRFLAATSLKPLKNEKRKGMINRFPMPACDSAHPPKLDEAVGALVPKSAKSYDNYLSRLQRYTMDAMGPLIWLYNERQRGREADIDGAIQTSLTLLGNAATHLSVERRKSLLKHLNKDLKPMAEAEFPDRGAHLFGDSFGKRAKKMADNVSALKGLQSKKSQGHFSGSGGSNRRPMSSKPQGRRQSWGSNTWSSSSGARKSVFGRLDPKPKGLPPQRSVKHQKESN